MNIMNINNNEITQSDYIAQLSGNLSPNTRRAYISDIKEFFGVKDTSEITMDMIRSVTVDDVNEYAEHLYKDKKRSSSTINRKLQALSKFYTFLMRRDIRAVEYNPFNPDEGANRFKATVYSKGKELSDDDIRGIVRLAEQDTSISGLRNKIILYILLTTGMRREEIANLYIGQIIRTQGKYIIDFTGKGRKDRFVLLADSIKEMINEYLKLRGLSHKDIDHPLFVSHSSNADITRPISTETIYQMVKKLAREAGVDDSISPHDFRHTYTTKSLEMGCAIEDVQDRLGHADIKTTRRYDHTRRVLNNNPAEEFMSMYS